MKLAINIPREFENHFLNDKFKDSLLRLNIDCRSGCLSGLYEIELLQMLVKAFEESEVLEDE